MARWMRNEWSVLALAMLATGVALAGDVTVQQGQVSATGLTVNDKIDAMYVGYYSHPYGYFREVDVWDDVVAGDDVDSAYVGYYTYPRGYFDRVYASDELSGTYVYAYKMDSFNGYDPPYVLYDRQSRQEVMELLLRAVPPEKQNGAALFFNTDTHKLEVCVPAEGNFYDLQGNLLGSVPKPQLPIAQFQTVYFLDPQTGQVRSRQRCVSNQYVLKKGYGLDEKTGRFVNQATGESVAREEALEIYAPRDGRYYDVRGNFLRAEPREEDAVYTTEYRLDSQTGQVVAKRKPVRDRYVLKRGYHLDRESGQFVDDGTGEVVPKETAVEIRRALEAEGGN